MWHETPISSAHRALLDQFVVPMRALHDPRELGLRLVFGLAEVLAGAGDAEALEAAGDILGDRLAADPSDDRERLRLAVRITMRFYELATEVGTDRPRAVAAKAAGLSGL